MSSNLRVLFIYMAGFLVAVHFAMVSYVNSSLLGKFVGDSALNLLYMAGSVLSIFLMFLAPRLMRRYGSIWSFIFFIIAQLIAVFGMGSINAALFVVPLFLIHIASDSSLYFCIDVHLEQETRAESTTGRKRGILLTFSNLAWVLSPLAMSFLIRGTDFSRVYLLSGLSLIPLLFIVSLFFRNTDQAAAHTADIFSAFKSLKGRLDEARIIVLQFALNFFFAWMVIYIPLLLFKEMGFGWDKIGAIFTVMLLPFFLFELPAGALADKKLGEREILSAGFIVMAGSTLAIPLITAPVLWVWAAVLFVTRVGASLVEISSETYFFKHVKEEDTGLISLFRMVRPLSYIAAPLIAMPVVHYFSYSESFYFLGAIVALALLFIPRVDTK